MNRLHLKVPLLAAVMYFGMNVNAQTKPHDSVGSEKKIDEVVLIGYGSQKKENVTGSIGTVSAKELEGKPNPNPLSSIQGKVAGVQITNAGAPGSSPRVDIRGVNSLTGKTVFIVDGNITEDISYLNSNDIESMSILKDPSSLAIFGAKASNGAVIIKTKEGRGKLTFNYNTYLGVKKVVNIPKMVDSDQYIELFNEKLRNEGVTDQTKFLTRANFPADTDWFKEVLANGIINSNDISASGSYKNLKYFVSAGYLDDEGTLKAGRGINSGNDYRRFTTRANLSYKINNYLTIGDNITYARVNTNNANNPLLAAYTSPPVYAPIDPATGDYSYFTLATIANPRATLDQFRSKTKEDHLLNNIWAEVKFLKNFTFRGSLTHDNINSNKYEYTPVLTYMPIDPKSNLITRDNRTRNYNWENTLTWKNKYGASSIEVLGGFSRSQNYFTGIYKKALNVNYDGTESSLNIDKGTDIVQSTSNAEFDIVPYQTRIESLFGRINYDYAGKYLFNASIRRDGATGFSKDDRYQIFPAVSVGWVISKEDFMKEQSFFNLLKLRASWGKLGNPQVKDQSYNLNTTIINAGAYFGGVGYPAQTISDIVDPTINWETTTGRDIGLEMAMLRNKLKFEFAYFSKSTDDVVYAINQPTTSGASNWNSFYTNAYSFNNKGFEGSVNYNTNVNEHFKFGVNANFATLKNEITQTYANSYNEPGNHLFGSTIVRLETGQPVGSYYGYQVAGVFQNAADVASSPSQLNPVIGGFKFDDRDGNGLIDDRDKTFLGSPIPKVTYGFGVNFGYDDFDLSVDFQGVSGNKIYNYNREQRYSNETWDADIYNNRWHGAGTSNSYSLVTNNQSVILPNSFFVEDGSFFRVRNIQLGYNLPKVYAREIGIQRMRLYASAQNPWTSFKYHGFSPEILNSDRVQMGVDNNIYPVSAIYTVGMNLTF